MKREPLKFNRILSFVSKMRELLKEDRFEIVHSYHLTEFWINSFLMKSKLQPSMIFTFNQNLSTSYHSQISKWLLRRVDNVLTLSAEVHDFVCESFALSPQKVKNIGFGLDVAKPDKDASEIVEIGCVVDNLSELQRLRVIVRVFSFLKSHHGDIADSLRFSIYLGPRVYNKRNAKNILTELEHEFYASDIMIYSLQEKESELKNLSILIGMAFEEPLNDFEMKALLNNIPVLFPRTAARQNLLYRYPGIGESYMDGDIREATSKIHKMVKQLKDYTNASKVHESRIYDVHGIDTYAEGLKLAYEGSYTKRQRYLASKRFLPRSS